MCYDTYALFLEYAELGYDYDSVTTKLKKQITNLEIDLRECDNQQMYLETIIKELTDHIALMEKQMAKDQRRLKIMKLLSYTSLGANATLMVILILIK